MEIQGPRYRFILIEEPCTTLPKRYRRTRPSLPFFVQRMDPLEALLEAFLKLSRRSEGATAWAPVLTDNPLAFLLDAMRDAVIVRRRDGEMIYANPAARRLADQAGTPSLMEPRPYTTLETFELADRRYERRCMTYELGATKMIIEVLCRMD